jgi:hypothetical protein
MTDELAPRRAPIKGGGRCDICDNRSFRRTRLGGWRHAGCEPDDRTLTPVEASARAAARRTAGLPVPAPQPGPASWADVIPIRTNGHKAEP